MTHLHTDKAFTDKIANMFEGDYKLVHHLAPPLTAKKNDKGELVKQPFGPWMRSAFGLLAKMTGRRGTALDAFGKTEERRMERELIERFEARVRELLPQLTTGNLRLAVDIAAVPLSMRGFGHVKQAAVVLARVREMELLHRFDAARYPAPPRQPQAGQIKGIPIANAAPSAAVASK